MNPGVFHRLLRDNGLKVTRTRLAVLGVLGRAHKPQSTQAILGEVREVGPADRVTVYRSLETFFKAGLVERVQAGDKAWRYHLSADHAHPRHPHFYCSGCGMLQCLPPDTLKLDLDQVSRVLGGRVEHCSVSLEGVCRRCLEAK